MLCVKGLVEGAKLGNILRIAILSICLSIMGCGPSKEGSTSGGTSATAGQPPKGDPRVSCAPSEDGGIICQ
jgi:hypothetical protein